MTDKAISEPIATAVSLASARIAARANGTDLDTAIEDRVRSITSEAEQITRRAFITRPRRVTLDAFPDAIRLEVSPVASVTSVKYFDEGGVERTLAPADYDVDLVSEPAYIVPAVGKSWPSTLDRINVVNIEYVAGYGASDAATPPGVKGYILARVEEFFGHAEPSPHVERALDSYKVVG